MKPEQKLQNRAGTVALTGNPNVGKSTLFNALTGMRQHTGNWPGKTVAVARGRYRWKNAEYLLVDLPGSYSLIPHSPEEEVTSDYIVSGEADVVVVVCDATCLERNLLYVLQILCVTRRVIVCLNLMDEARRKGIRIDIAALSAMLQTQVVGVSARDKKTLAPLLDAVDRCISEQNDMPENGLLISSQDIDRISREIARAVITLEDPDYARKDRAADKVLTGKRWGYPLMVLLLGALLWLTIVGANYPSAVLSRLLFGMGDALYSFLQRAGISPVIRNALILGVWRVLSWVISVMLPPMAIFFPLFTLLEDVGYLPRIAFNLDKPFHRCKACGKQALTMSMGFGCNAVGVTGCRIIESPRERLLAILTNSFVPCNGRFPLLITLLTIFFVTGSSLLTALLLTGIILLGIVFTLLATKLLSVTFLRGKPSSFALELPPYRKPQIGQVIVRSIFDRTLFVLGRAAAVAAPAGLVLWAMANISLGETTLLRACAAFLEPLAAPLGMDGSILLAFILGWPANETVLPIALMIYLSTGTLSDGASSAQIGAILVSNGWTWATACSVLLFTLLHWPCSTTLLTVYKETKSVRWTLLASTLPTAFGALACMIFHHIALLLT